MTTSELTEKAEKLNAERATLYAKISGRDTLSQFCLPIVRRIHTISRKIDNLSREIAETTEVKA